MIYFIQAGPSGPVKIGYSKTYAGVRKRLIDFQIGNHETLFILRVIRGRVADERALHRRFIASFIRGEWFRFNPEMLTIDVAVAEELAEPIVSVEPDSIPVTQLLAEWAAEDATLDREPATPPPLTDRVAERFPPFKQIPLPPAPASQGRL